MEDERDAVGTVEAKQAVENAVLGLLQDYGGEQTIGHICYVLLVLAREDRIPSEITVKEFGEVKLIPKPNDKPAT